MIKLVNSGVCIQYVKFPARLQNIVLLVKNN